MNRFRLSIFLLALFHPVFAGDLIETNSDFDGLPDSIVFDCFPSSDKSGGYFQPLSRQMRIPKNFERSPDKPNWFNWNVRIVGEGESVVFPFAAIQFGDLDIGIKWIEQEFTRLSRASENGYGVDIYVRTPQPEDVAKDHWLFLLTEEKFLKVIARAEIDWISLLACFE